MFLEQSFVLIFRALRYVCRFLIANNLLHNFIRWCR